MQATHVLLKDLNSYEACETAIELIETDYHNIIGGLKAWNSGYATYLTSAAEKKIAAIRARRDKKWPDEAEEV